MTKPGIEISRRQFLKLSLAGCLLAASYPIMIERYLVQVNTYRIGFANLPSAFNGFRIAHLTDLHYGLLMPQIMMKSIIERTNSLKTDMIVCTGDYVHETNSTDQIDTIWPLLCELNAIYGVYSVLGNHDHWADTQRSFFWLEYSGQNIHHQAKAIQKEGQRIWIAGAGDLYEDEPGIDQALINVPDQEFKIVLAHNPDTADLPFNADINLMISGHTHGGQVNIPGIGAPVVPVNNKSYTSGLFDTKNGKLFISKGIGWAVAPIRFNCAPEIAILELVQTF